MTIQWFDDDNYYPPDMSDPDMAFAHAVDVIEEVNSWGINPDHGIPTHVENALQDAWSIIYAWESFMVQQVNDRVIRCPHCDQTDDLARCSRCEILTCSRCRDRLHADSCGRF